MKAAAGGQGEGAGGRRKHIEAVDPKVEADAMENAAKAMVEAAKKGDKVAVRRQLEAGVEVDATNELGLTALIEGG